MESTPKELNPQCPKCKQKILQSLSVKCMYCGEPLPEQLHPSDETKRMIIERNAKINAAHDLATEKKQAKTKNKKAAKRPPTLPSP